MKVKKFLKEWIPSILFVVIFVILFNFFVASAKIVGDSMDPTLANGERVLVSKKSTIKRFDIVIAKEPGDVSTTIVKRVIGLPGDKVSMKNDTLRVNNKVIEEDYLNKYKKLFENNELDTVEQNSFSQLIENQPNFTSTFETVVPDNEYLLLGDNRIISKDSRAFGCVSENLIEGKCILVFWPFSNFQMLSLNLPLKQSRLTY